MSIVTLVPWRPGDEWRERLWEATRPALDALGFPIVTGDSRGPWARARACNEAARRAGDWEIALIADADTIPEPSAIYEAIERVAFHGGALRPHDRLWLLGKGETLSYLRDRQIARRPRRRNLGGGLLVISREAWERVDGYDERFIGWGHEDSDLSTRLLVEADWDVVKGQAWHLYHPRDATNTPERHENRRLMLEIQRAHRGTIRRVSQERGVDLRTLL